MAKFNTPTRVGPRTLVRPGAGPVRVTSATPTTRTHEGAPAYERDLRGELFLLAVSNMVGEDTFYESAADRDARYVALVRRAAIADPAWTAGLLAWLRRDANMRSASLVGAAEFVAARLAAAGDRVHLVDEETGRGIDRWVVDAVLRRADEPGELLAYWTTRHGRALPKPVKRGVGDAVRRLYTEYSLLKYDTSTHAFRFADVLELTHPAPASPAQGALFRHALDRRHGHATAPEVLEGLRVVFDNALLRGLVAAGDVERLLDPAALAAAGMTWEDALSLAGDRVDRARLWEALLPSLGYMALLRNLRNLDEAGISVAAAKTVAERLADPGQVRRSRQLPFRFLAAYENVTSLRWSQSLEEALNLSLANVPELPGRSLVLVDTSASMTNAALSRRSKMTPVQVAALFGAALAARSDVDLVGFASGWFRHPVPRGTAVLRVVESLRRRVGEVGHGTEIARSLRESYDGHDRVFVISDMQTMGSGVPEAVPTHVPLYGFNLGGYRPAAIPAGLANRVELGGLTDATFRLVPLLEAGRSASWPWESSADAEVDPAASDRSEDEEV